MEQKINNNKNNKIIFYLIFLCLLYPLFHGFFTFIVVSGIKAIFNFESPYINIILLGWKEAAMLLIFFLLLKDQYNLKFYLFILIVLSFLFFSYSSINFLKEIFIPFLLLYLVLENRILIKKKVIEKKIFIKNFILFICFISILISVWDIFFRITNNVNTSNYYDYNYLLTLNKIRCSKSLITSSLEFYNICIYGGFPNFYKILLEGENFIVKNVLFMPAGDSVTLSYIFLYLILILIFFNNSNLFKNNSTDFVLLCLMIAQIYTFNRANSIFSLIIFFHYCYKKKNLIMAYPILLIFLYYFEKIFLSIFDPNVPSNIGHTDSYEQLFLSSNASHLNEISITNILMLITVFLIFLFLITKAKASKKTLFVIISILTLLLMFYLNIPLSLFGTGLPSPNESNYLKIIFSYGVIGGLLYIYILSNLAYNINDENFYVKILSLNLLVYQFLAPHVISGFVVFTPAILILTLFKQNNEFDAIKKKN